MVIVRSVRRGPMADTNSGRKVLTFVTGNVRKLEEVKAILAPFCDVVPHDIDLPELQGAPNDIALDKAKAAFEILKKPLIIEDTCLCYNALGGLPGPYIKWFLKKIKHEGLYKLLDGYEDKTAYALCTLAYCDGQGNIKIFEGRTNGRIVPPRGPRDFGWTPCFEPDG
uniref:XTP/dITP diphosphatase n=1 Tax=Plectus sambesii TaxID=2011161 RepID=A0A914WT02_9BILA